MELKSYLYMTCTGVALLVSSKLATRGGGVGTWGLLLLSFAGLVLLLGFDLLTTIQSQRPRRRERPRRRRRERFPGRWEEEQSLLPRENPIKARG
jgi:hypothetical protein